MNNIIVISLERAKERREKMIKQLDNLKLNYVILDAIDAQTLGDKEKDKIITKGRWRVGEQFQPGEIGCTMSHINALKFAKEKQWPYVIVFEDDITIADDFKKRIDYLFKILPKDWEHVYLSGKPDKPPMFTDLLLLNVKKSIFTQQIHSIIINASVYDKIINELSTFETTTDDIYSYMIVENKLVSYTYYPFVTHANSKYSYIWNKSAGHNIENISKKYFKNNIL